MYLSFWFFENIIEKCYAINYDLYIEAHISDKTVGYLPDHTREFIIKIRPDIYRIYGYNQFILFDITRKYMLDRSARCIQKYYKRYKALKIIKKHIKLYVITWLDHAYTPPNGKLYTRLLNKYI